MRTSGCTLPTIPLESSKVHAGQGIEASLNGIARHIYVGNSEGELVVEVSPDNKDWTEIAGKKIMKGDVPQVVPTPQLADAL